MFRGPLETIICRVLEIYVFRGETYVVHNNKPVARIGALGAVGGSSAMFTRNRLLGAYPTRRAQTQLTPAPQHTMDAVDVY